MPFPAKHGGSIYAQKENEVKRKLNEKQKRQEKRVLKKENQNPKTGKMRKNVAKNKCQIRLKRKTTCSLCNDELVSDAEEEAERNIGCDFCPRRYHLHCTEPSDLPYFVAAEKDYKCNFCCFFFSKYLGTHLVLFQNNNLF